MTAVRKAIIPAAGLGTRFLPATKAMPKEMLPIVDKPTIQYIVEEAIESGIKDIIIVTGKGKRSIEDHFDNAAELEISLLQQEKYELLEKVRAASNLVDIHYIRQKEPKGLGHAIWCARNFIGNEPFAVLLGDDIVKGKVPCTKQLIDQYAELRRSVIGVQVVSPEETSRYGIIDPLFQNERQIGVKNLVEKPKPGTAPSNLAIMGRYVLTPDIFDLIASQQEGVGSEIQLTDALQRLNALTEVYAYAFEGKRYDIGDKLGFIMTNIEFALMREDLGPKLMDYIHSIRTNKETVGM